MSDKSLALTGAPQLISVDPRRAALDSDAFEPQDPGQMMQLAKDIADTTFAPKEFSGKPGACFIAMLYGRGLGLGALQALQGIGVINGKPVVYGETFWALIISHPEFVECEEDVTDNGAVVTLTRKNRKPYRAEFSLADAKAAKLTEKDGPWKLYPKGQMLWRARHRAATALFADALKGVAPREVALDYIEGEVVPPRRDPDPLPAESVTNAPAEAKPGDQPRPDADPKLTAEEVKQWNDGWTAALKGNGVDDQKARNEFKRAELERLGAAKSSDIRQSQLAESLKHAQEFQPPQAQAEPVVDEREKLARGWMNDLGFGMFDVDRIVKKHTKDDVCDWGGVCLELEPDLRRKGLIQ